MKLWCADNVFLLRCLKQCAIKHKTNLFLIAIVSWIIWSRVTLPIRYYYIESFWVCDLQTIFWYEKNPATIISVVPLKKNITWSDQFRLWVLQQWIWVQVLYDRGRRVNIHQGGVLDILSNTPNQLMVIKSVFMLIKALILRKFKFYKILVD